MDTYKFTAAPFYSFSLAPFYGGHKQVSSATFYMPYNIACTGPVHWGFVVLELATSLTYDTTYVETYHWYIFIRACY
jgi:hypothetical protein